MSRGRIMFQPAISQEVNPACRDHCSPLNFHMNFPFAISLTILSLVGYQTVLGAWSTIVLAGGEHKSTGQGRYVSGRAGGFRLRAPEAHDANGSRPDDDAVQKKSDSGKGGDAGLNQRKMHFQQAQVKLPTFLHQGLCQDTGFARFQDALAESPVSAQPLLKFLCSVNYWI